MKRIILFAASCAVLAACSKTDGNVPAGTPFKAGDVVTLNVGAVKSSHSKVNGTLNSDGGIDFKWETGDKILVTVGGSPAEFTLSSGAGLSSATFTGTMPADGTNFDVQFPVTDPSLATQGYVSNALPHNMMKATAKDCTTDTPFELTPQYAALRLNLYGTSQTISKIVVKDASSNTYTLSISPAATLPTKEAEAMAFLVVVPAGEYKFSAEIFDNAATPASICSFKTTSAKTFQANTILNMAARKVESVVDLSASATANCYIVSDEGGYKFKTVKGNSDTSVGDVKGVKVLWESFGTSSAPNVGDLIKADVSYDNGYITFSTSDTFKEGNALIAAYSDAGCSTGNVLWSWHIWLTDDPAEQVYKNSAGTMMDRNLGATSATPGEVGALGLLYQWGRKDPFLGSSVISESFTAASTGSWNDESASSHLEGNNTLSYSISHPTTFLSNDDKNGTYDWYSTSMSNVNHDLWRNPSGSAKTFYDPCPQGWRVPDKEVWLIALGTEHHWTTSGNWDGSNKGMDFGSTDKTLGSGTIWYPAAGYIPRSRNSLNNVGSEGNYWSCTPRPSYYDGDTERVGSYSLGIYKDGTVTPPPSTDRRAIGQSVRCLKDTDMPQGSIGSMTGTEDKSW